MGSIPDVGQNVSFGADHQPTARPLRAHAGDHRSPGMALAAHAAGRQDRPGGGVGGSGGGCPGDRPGHPAVEERARTGRAAGAPARPRGSRGPDTARATSALRERPAGDLRCGRPASPAGRGQRVGAGRRSPAGRRRAAAGADQARRLRALPRNVAGIGAEDSTDQRFGRYACLAVTAEFIETESTSGGLLGHPYRMRIDFDTGRYAFCKIAGRPAEGQLKRRLGVTVPPCAEADRERNVLRRAELTTRSPCSHAGSRRRASTARSSRRRWRWPRRRRTAHRPRAWS